MVAGCALKKPPDAAAIKEQALPQLQAPAQWTAPGAGAGAVADNWLATFNDDQLAAAVAEALAHNADLRVGATRVEQAQLHAKLAGAKLYPSVDLLARGGGKLSGDGSGLQGGVLSASWELDLWGRVRYGRAASAAQAASAAGGFRVRARSRLRRSWPRAGSSPPRRGCRSRRRARPFARARSSCAWPTNGRASASAIRRMCSSRAPASAAIATSCASSSWDGPRRFARSSSCSAATPRRPRRPRRSCRVFPARFRRDCHRSCWSGGRTSIAAERRVAAAFNRVREAKAARLPVISLTTGVSAISSELFVLKDHDNPMWSVGASLLAPLFRGGALKTQVEIRTAEQKQAIAEYAAVGLRAFGEVEGALAAEIAAREREQILTQALADNQQALGVVQTQFKVGSTDLRFVEQRQLALTADPLRADPRAGRAARAARESPPRARRQLRAAAAAATHDAAGRAELNVAQPFRAAPGGHSQPQGLRYGRLPVSQEALCPALSSVAFFSSPFPPAARFAPPLRYPLTLVVSAQAKNATATVTSTLNIRVERMMTETNRTKVTDALKYGGYGNFLPALRTLPAIGTIALDTREVQVRYVREQPDGKGYRLILVADRPLFFLGADAAKARAGYELTMVDLRIDEHGAGTGTMAGAARVKPAPDGSVILDNYAEAPVELTIRPGGPSR